MELLGIIIISVLICVSYILLFYGIPLYILTDRYKEKNSKPPQHIITRIE